MSTAAARTSEGYSVQEYLIREAQAQTRHEYDRGEILAMSGVTFEHSQVAANTIGEFRTRLRGKKCQPLDSNIKVRMSEVGKYVYPDVTIVCGPPEFDTDDPKRTTIINPTVVIEVLSLSTETYDRGLKFAGYRTLESLKEYVLISQWEPWIETYRRHEDGRWTITSFEGMQTLLKLPSLSIEVPLSEIYLNVVFQPRPAPPQE
jgi:Uma2 family endonuclease